MTPLCAADVGVVVVNYNNAADTLACLATLDQLTTAPGWIVVCDNGSSDESLARLRYTWQDAAVLAGEDIPLAEGRRVLLALTENLGFAAGNNAGLRLLRQTPGCRACWLLNNDTLPAPEALDALLRRANLRLDAGMVGSTMVYVQPADTVQCLGGGSFNRWLGTSSHLGEGLPAAGPLPDIQTVESRLDYITGASLLVRQEVLERIGLLAEDYFLYYEDLDWGLRATGAGFRLAWAPDSIVLHREGGTTGARSAAVGARPRRSPVMDYLGIRNRLQVLRRHHAPALPVALASLAVVLGRRLLRGQPERCVLLLRAAWHGLLGRMGKP